MVGGVHENMKAWEPEEDRLIIELLATIGPRWSKIVKALPGRTISSIRNRWQRIDKGLKMREEGHESKNRCNICGQPKRGHVCFEKIRRDAEQSQAENDAVLNEVLPLDVSDMLPPGDGGEASGASDSVADEDHEGEPSEAADGGGGDDDDRLDVSMLVAQVNRQDTSESASMDVAPTRSTAVDASTQTDPDMAGFDSDDDDTEAPDVPIVCRIKSGPRICKELGFDDAAAVDLADCAPPLDDFGVIPVSQSRYNSTRSVRSESEVALTSTLPPLSSAGKRSRTASFGDAIP